MNNPVYVLRLNTLKKNLSEYNKYFTVYYPVKCNDNHKLLSLLCEYGSYFEVETKSHLFALKKIGVPPQKILFYSPFTNEADIELAIEYGVDFFVVSDAKGVSFLESKGINYKFLIRISESYVCNCRKKFGTSEDELYTLLKNVNNGDFCGVSFNINAEFNTLINKKNMINYIADILTLKKNPQMIINIGGGINLSDCKEIYHYIKTKGDYSIIAEPGRDLINSVIDLIASVVSIDTKTSVAFINVGIYNGLLDAVIKKKFFKVQATNSSTKHLNYLLSGPTADVSDILGEYELPELKVGDKIIIKECGAYSEVLHTNFYGYEKSELIIME